MKTAQANLQELLDAHPVAQGVYVRVHGKNLIVGRPEPFGATKEVLQDDRVRFTRIDQKTFGLSVRRHTGRWQKVPFSGTLEELVNDVLSSMQHLLASYS